MDKNTWIGLLAAAACLAFVFLNQGSPKNSAVEEMINATMAVHDEAMKEMADMNRIGRLLKRERDSLATESPRRDSLVAVIQTMKKAEEDMYQWMVGFKRPSEETPAAEALLYLEQQKSMIDKNEQDIRAALEAGRGLIRQ